MPSRTSYRESGDSSTPADRATIIHEYHAAYNAVIQPDKMVACTRYFVSRWMPLLGGTGTQIVLALRSLGYYNPRTGECRDGIEIDLPALARMAGCSPDTVKREFGNDPKTGLPRNPSLHRFIQRESQYRRHPDTGQVLRAVNVYRVKMDDPIHDDDLPKLQEALDRRDKPAAHKVQSAPYDAAPIVQSAPNAVQSAPGSVQNAQRKVQSAPSKVQNAPTLIDYSSLSQSTTTSPETTAPPALGEGVVAASQRGKRIYIRAGISFNGLRDLCDLYGKQAVLAELRTRHEETRKLDRTPELAALLERQEKTIERVEREA